MNVRDETCLRKKNGKHKQTREIGMFFTFQTSEIARKAHNQIYCWDMRGKMENSQAYKGVCSFTPTLVDPIRCTMYHYVFPVPLRLHLVSHTSVMLHCVSHASLCVYSRPSCCNTRSKTGIHVNYGALRWLFACTRETEKHTQWIIRQHTRMTRFFLAPLVSPVPFFRVLLSRRLFTPLMLNVCLSRSLCFWRMQLPRNSTPI